MVVWFMHDFNCTKADDMNFKPMAERTRYLKENPEGVRQMCKVMEDMRNETAETVLLQSIKNLMETMKLTADQAMEALKISENDKIKYAGKL